MSRLFMLKSNNSQLTLYFKKMKKYLLLSIVFSLFLCGCTQKQNEVKNLSGMETIPITDFETYNGRFSEFAEAVEMIPLEFTDESILGEIKKVVLQDGTAVSCIGMGTFGSDRFSAESVANAV